MAPVAPTPNAEAATNEVPSTSTVAPSEATNESSLLDDDDSELDEGNTSDDMFLESTTPSTPSKPMLQCTCVCCVRKAPPPPIWGYYQTKQEVRVELYIECGSFGQSAAR